MTVIFDRDILKNINFREDEDDVISILDDWLMQTDQPGSDAFRFKGHRECRV